MFIDKGLKEERKRLDRGTREEKQRKLQETIFQITIPFFLILISSYICQGRKLNILQIGNGRGKEKKKKESSAHMCKTTINKHCSVAALLNR